MAEEILRQAAIGFVVWLLVVTLMWVYNEKEKAGQEEKKKVEFEEKRGTRECNVGAKTCADIDKEVSYLKSNNENGASANPAICERKRPVRFFGPKEQHKIKLRPTVI